MRVAHVTSNLCRESAGLGSAVASISLATRDAGCEVKVFGLESDLWSEIDYRSWKGPAVEVFATAKWTSSLKYAQGMYSAILDYNADIIHLHGLWSYPAIAALRAHNTSRSSLVVSAHGMLNPVSLKYKRLRKWIATNLYQSKLLKSASVLHATSTEESSDYLKTGLNNRIEVIPLAVDVRERPEVELTLPYRRMVFIGRLHHQKGLDWLVLAWLEVQAEFPDWELCIVGPVDNSYSQEIQQLRRLAIGKRVSFLGGLYGDQKDHILATASIFIAPSRSENFSLAIAEALMFEVPVITTKGTPWSSLVRANAGWCTDTNVPALVAAMRDAMKRNDVELRSMGQSGKRLIESEFSPNLVSCQWRRVYMETLLSKDARVQS
jgi:glycosyltransferase involved in cell wall biosynthesis